ncbi:tetratricopeptide repeat protein, partial [Zoogloea sp.]|uniref:tetratricopeptide repeat protein n=1 Tax=Zoogloea sp. TaxID=49181 RepID=UPI0014166097
MQLSRFCLALLVGSGLAFPLVPATADVVLGNSSSTLAEGAGRPDSEAINRGRVALRNRNLEQAEKYFSEAYRQNPASVEAMLGLAVISHSQGKAKLARDWMASAVAMAPGQPAVLQAQARLLVEQGLPASAEESYRAAIAANPDGLQLKLDLASLYTDTLRKPAQAVSLLRDALRQKPDSADILHQLALAYMGDGRLDEAARTLDDALRRDPAEPRILHARGLVAQRQGQAERALEYFDKALAVKKDFSGAMISRGDVLQLLGRTEAAVDAYRKAIPMAPGSALPHALLGQALNRLKRPAEAEKAYREALRLEPDNFRVANNLAVLLAAQKTGLDDALAMIRRALEREPNRATYLDTLGLVHQARGDKAAARQAFERALALESGNSEFRLHLAQLGNAPVPASAPP